MLFNLFTENATFLTALQTLIHHVLNRQYTDRDWITSSILIIARLIISAALLPLHRCIDVATRSALRRIALLELISGGKRRPNSVPLTLLLSLLHEGHQS